MRVGVTGSSGFIGSALVDALTARGDEVVPFVRPASTTINANSIRWDPARHLVEESDLRRVGGFDAVVHLAGAGIADRRWSADRKRQILESRTTSTALLVEALGAMTSGTPILASGSAIGVYGSRDDEQLDETSSCGADFLANVCQQWENAASPLSRQGAAVSALRTGIVMSRHGGALKKQLPLFRAGLGGQLGSGRQWLSPIALVDHIRAVLWIIDRGLAGPVNLVAPNPLTNRDFTTALGRALHRPTMARVPAIALKVVLGAELATDALLASQRVVPKVLTEDGFSFSDPDIATILTSSLR